MAITITWVIEQLDVRPTEGSYTDVVITAHWRCNGTDGTYNGSVYGTCSFAHPEDDFTPYDQLTEQQVLGWCWANGVDKTATEAAVETQIQDKIAPPVISPSLPWKN